MKRNNLEMMISERTNLKYDKYKQETNLEKDKYKEEEI